MLRAYRILDESGLISTQQDRGTYIWDNHLKNTQHLRKHGLDELTLSYLEQTRNLSCKASEMGSISKDGCLEE